MDASPTPQSKFEILKIIRSPYNHIYVVQNGEEREMWFKGSDGFFLQSRIDEKRFNPLVLVYSRMMIASLLFQPAPERILIVGLGGGVLSSLLRKWYPNAFIDVVEIDQDVIQVARDFFFVNEDPRYRVINDDGRIFVQNQIGKKKYDLVLLDAFKSGSIPFHLKTREFYQEINQILNPEGIVASNLYGKSNIRKPIDRKTFLSVFERVYCFEDADSIATVLIATNQARERTPADLRFAASKFRHDDPLSMLEVASLYRPGKFKDNEASIFHDDFSKEDFVKAVERNNSDAGSSRRYPIQCNP
jgi:spermidine synthase